MSDGGEYPIVGHSEEELRQAAVFASGVLATRGNPALQDIVARAAELFAVPIVAVSVIDRDRQWFPAIFGLDAEETARSASFCTHTILTPDRTMCVPDAKDDPRFVNNPAVTGDPHVRFYAGAPLVTSAGDALGALCVVDSLPRSPLSPEQDAELRALAQEVVAEIERADHIRAFGTEAIAYIVGQIRDAAETEDEQLLLKLDRLLRTVEHRIGQGLVSRGTSAVVP